MMEYFVMQTALESWRTAESERRTVSGHLYHCSEYSLSIITVMNVLRRRCGVSAMLPRSTNVVTNSLVIRLNARLRFVVDFGVCVYI